MTVVEQGDLQTAARTLGAAMARLVRRVSPPVSADAASVQDLFAFVQALGLPAGDGRHLSGVVAALSRALERAARRAQESP